MSDKQREALEEFEAFFKNYPATQECRRFSAQSFETIRAALSTDSRAGYPPDTIRVKRVDLEKVKDALEGAATAGEGLSILERALGEKN